jgi:Uma2 family endonuclease
MAVQQQTYTVEEFWEVAQLPENVDKRLELREGAIYEMPSSSPLNAIITHNIARSLGNHVAEYDLGYVTSADGTYKVSPTDAFVPDVAFISKARVPRIPEKNFESAPDLAIEVISPSESARDVHDKVWAYLRGGSRLVWAVYPKQKVVDVYRLVAEDHLDLQTIGIDGVLEGGDVLRGFTLPVRDIFPEETSGGEG